MGRTNAEYYNMFYLYAKYKGNAQAAAARYREMYPGERPPSAAAFHRLAKRIYTTGSSQPVRWCRSATTLLDAALAEFDRDGTQSVRAVSKRLGVDWITVDRVLYPSKYEPPHTLFTSDFTPRYEYSKWLLGKIERNPSFCKYVLWTGEAVFTWEGCLNLYNSDLPNDENPIAIHPCAAQGRWTIHLWAGICDDFVVGPYILPDRLDGQTYKIFLEHVLPGLLEEIPLEIRKNMYFQHNGTPIHCAANVQAYLDQAFRDRWIGCNGSVPWPPRSSDMNPVDFFLWRFLMFALCRMPLQTRKEVVACIHATVAKISPAMLRNIQSDIRWGAEMCVKQYGSFFEQLL